MHVFKVNDFKRRKTSTKHLHAFIFLQNLDQNKITTSRRQTVRLTKSTSRLKRRKNYRCCSSSSGITEISKLTDDFGGQDNSVQRKKGNKTLLYCCCHFRLREWTATTIWAEDQHKMEQKKKFFMYRGDGIMPLHKKRWRGFLLLMWTVNERNIYIDTVKNQHEKNKKSLAQFFL